jgi:DNA-binding winged helix-turn-helix (wHTH) protein
MIARFGEFELDMDGCRLMRDSVEIRLAKQPMDLLIFLIKRHGELTSREQIAEALWGSQDFSGAEHSINTTIRRVRAALGEESNSARYIETVTRRGYRFIAPVTVTGETTVAVEVETPIPGAFRRFPIPAWLGWAAIVLAIAGAATALIGAWTFERPPLSWKQLTNPVHPTWGIASDGRSIFWTEYAESQTKPWQVPIDGSSEARPVPIPFPNAFVMDATPAGQLLLIARDNCRSVDSGTCEGSLWELSLASAKTRRIGNLTGLEAAWSPDGLHLAFARRNEFWFANHDGSDPRKASDLPGRID